MLRVVPSPHNLNPLHLSLFPGLFNLQAPLKFLHILFFLHQPVCAIVHEANHECIDFLLHQGFFLLRHFLRHLLAEISIVEFSLLFDQVLLLEAREGLGPGPVLSSCEIVNFFFHNFVFRLFQEGAFLIFWIQVLKLGLFGLDEELLDGLLSVRLRQHLQVSLAGDINLISIFIQIGEL